ncbi:MAG: 5' nucleotidase, NT5C type [Mycobacteriales bacterium]
MILNVDLDGTICTEEQTFERALAKPIPGAREALAAMIEAGHTVVVYSSRSWSELKMTEAWLREHAIPYSGLHLGKPVADFFIDDRAVRFTDWRSALGDLNERLAVRGHRAVGEAR